MRNPARPDLVGRIRRSDEEIRQLRIMRNLPPNFVDLGGYLNTGWDPVEYFDSEGPFAVVYQEGSRIWMAGAVAWTDAGLLEAGSLNGDDGTPLPEEFRPVNLANITFDFDWDTTGWNPAPVGNSSDATITARIQADVTTDGYINFESLIANYQGRAQKSTGGFYTGVPDGSTLVLDGISWTAPTPV